jgi:hypothetical protein
MQALSIGGAEMATNRDKEGTGQDARAKEAQRFRE